LDGASGVRQRRGGTGIKIAKVTPKTGSVINGRVLAGPEEEVLAMSEKGQAIRLPIASISILGRATQGVRIMKLDEGDKIASITTI